MKKLFILSLIIVFFAALSCGGSKDAEDVNKIFSKKVKLETIQQKGSYAIGFNMGQSVRQTEGMLDLFNLLQGVVDGYSGDEKAQMAIEDIRKALGDFQQEVGKKLNERRKVQGEKNKVEGKKFLDENAKKEGVKVTASGLQYKIIKEGTGPSPKAEEQVKVNYKGALIDGTEFDSSYKRGTPATFPLNRVIKGWTEGLQLMKVGSVYKFFIPSELGYGERSKGRHITPNSVLIFEVELLEILPSTKPPVRKKPAAPPAKKKEGKPADK